MTIIRFIREGFDLQCKPGENLRELVIREKLQLYGLKGLLGNCNGAGQCSTCFISVEGGNKNSLSPLTLVEEEKLKNRPENWRLACQTLIKSSAVILTKPQSPPSNLDELKKISETQYEFTVEVKEIHLNTGKIAHGGFLSTIADTGMGTAAHSVAGDKRCVTINLDMKFISVGQLGDKLTGKVKILKKTKTLVFISCEILNSSDIVASASGTWKILQ